MNIVNVSHFTHKFSKQNNHLNFSDFLKSITIEKYKFQNPYIVINIYFIIIQKRNFEEMDILLFYVIIYFNYYNIMYFIT